MQLQCCHRRWERRERNGEGEGCNGFGTIRVLEWRERERGVGVGVEENLSALRLVCVLCLLISKS